MFKKLDFMFSQNAPRPIGSEAHAGVLLAGVAREAADPELGDAVISTPTFRFRGKFGSIAAIGPWPNVFSP